MKKIILLIVTITVSTFSDYMESEQPSQKDPEEEVEKQSENSSQNEETKIELTL